jgi:hypothetical protein
MGCQKCKTELLTVFNIQSIFGIGFVLEIKSLLCHGGDGVAAGDTIFI